MLVQPMTDIGLFSLCCASWKVQPTKLNGRQQMGCCGLFSTRWTIHFVQKTNGTEEMYE